MSGDLQHARNVQSALQDILERQAVRSRDMAALGRIHALCRDAAAATEDEYCRTRLHLIADYATELLGSDNHCKWESGTLSGAEFLRRRIREALELYRGRIARRAQMTHEPVA